MSFDPETADRPLFTGTGRINVTERAAGLVGQMRKMHVDAAKPVAYDEYDLQATRLPKGLAELAEAAGKIAGHSFEKAMLTRYLGQVGYNLLSASVKPPSGIDPDRGLVAVVWLDGGTNFTLGKTRINCYDGTVLVQPHTQARFDSPAGVPTGKFATFGAAER